MQRISRLTCAPLVSFALCCALLSLPVMAAERQCEVVEGTIVCQTQKDLTAGLDPTAKGLVVYSEMDNRNGATLGFGGRGYVDGVSELEATIRTADGSEHVRRVHMRFLERENSSDRRMMIMENPDDQKGMALLTISNPTGLDDQWLFDTTQKQVRRVSQNHIGTPFAGTDLNFEDLSLQNIDRYDYGFLGEEKLSGHDCYIVVRRPKYPYSSNGKLVTWVDKAHYYPVKIDYYDRHDTLVKTLTLFDYQQYDDRFWRAGRMELVNHLTAVRTTLQWSGYRFNVGLSEHDFDLNALQRPRTLR
ncbi:MAG: outer membrane lipoprotein-sorting protein [Pseudomonadales bacterium]|jgi:outer membrane lipoprotein-sorting protein|nr:outer membrane lipoprotein-sorting protein [Pseudomonadales bacterium]MCP5333783.1 outer membrane lipoprotein-sorting protein [Pseudomonadales bacterium]HMU90343.1 outer membrane lipoprotein-sorting protein [Pseudomonadales bacterium]HMW14162.1 outer membrane lipoprotein-sorting protein [Pseudomonadales bacterium]HMW84040.1 outer membrane lipoprotein-sorting protein [Pseudomonadales bacterium]